MKKVLLIVLIILGVLIMLKPVSALIKDSVGNIVYRGNVVTGTVAVDNGNGSYDVYIGESAEAYPNIFTLAENPDLEVGDKVRILYENGIKELPIILPPTTAREYIFVLYQSGGNYYLNRYTYDGVLNAELGVLSEVSGAIIKICVDSNHNIYIICFDYPDKIIHKYDKNGNFLLSKTIVSTENYFTLSPGGYIYSLDSTTRNYIRERKLSDLSVNNTYTLSEDRYYYLTFDSDSYAYLYAWSTTSSLYWGYVKYKFITGMGFAIISKHLQTNNASSYDSWVVAGDYIGCSYSTPYTINKNLDSDRVNWSFGYDLFRITSTGNYFITLGESGGKLIMEKYSPDRTKQWEKEVTSSFTDNLQYCGIAAYPF